MLDRSNFYSYQNRIVDFIKKNPVAAIWSFMGSGKTASTLTAFMDLHDALDVRRMLVIAPLRVARKVWRDELNEWAHLKGLTISHICNTDENESTPGAVYKALRTPADIHTINRERLMWLDAQFLDQNKLLMRWPWDMVVMDESQSFKSQDSERWKSMKRLRRLMTRVVALTGTPAPNGLLDLWAQYYLLDRGRRLGQFITPFRDRWFETIRDENHYTRWVPRDTAEKEIYREIADITLSLREEDYMSELPKVSINKIRVALRPEIMGRYRRFEKEFVLQTKSEQITAANMSALCGKLLQLSNGAVYDSEHRWHEIHQEKLDALLDVLEFLPKALIAYSFQHDLERISAHLDRFGRRHGKKWAVLRTDDSLERWANGEYDYGIIHPASAGHGLNDVYKSGCEDIVWFGLTNNLEFYQQLNARLTGGNRRTGRRVTIHHIICDGTKDERLLPLLESKNTVQEDLRRNVAAWLKED